MLLRAQNVGLKERPLICFGEDHGIEINYVAFKMKAATVQETIEDFPRGERKVAVLVMYGCRSMTDGMDGTEIKECFRWEATTMVIGAAGWTMPPA